VSPDFTVKVRIVGEVVTAGEELTEVGILRICPIRMLVEVPREFAA
jgi:hypothetical protein